MTMIAIWLAAPLLLSAPIQSPPRCQKPLPTTATPLASTLDDYFARAEAFGFSGSVIVAAHGAVLLRKSYGYADRRTLRCNTPETVFGVSSVDKQIIATAIMKLAELGRLHVTDSLGKFFDR